MRTSANIFIGGGFAGPRWTDLFLAWSDAADDAKVAYVAWCGADRAGQDAAFLVFQAALDREEAGARVLEAHATSNA